VEWEIGRVFLLGGLHHHRKHSSKLSHSEVENALISRKTEKVEREVNTKMHDCALEGGGGLRNRKGCLPRQEKEFQERTTFNYTENIKMDANSQITERHLPSDRRAENCGKDMVTQRR